MRDDGRAHEPFDLPGMTPEEACDALIGASALTWAELWVLESAAAGQETLLDLTREQAASRLALWRGPIPGLRLMPLPHWGTAWVDGGAPYDPDRRAQVAGNPFDYDPEE